MRRNPRIRSPPPPPPPPPTYMASGPINSVNPLGGGGGGAAHMPSGSTDSVNLPGAAANAPRRLGSILLDWQRSNFCKGIGRGNQTTATAASRGDYLVSLSFWMAEPPGISCFSVDCSSPPTDIVTQYFTVLPHVVGAEGPFVLLRARFNSYYNIDEYFMYKVSYGKPPSLEWVPLPDDDIEGIALGRVSEFGVVPLDHKGQHYVLVALCDDPDAPADYHLRIYLSETKTWHTKTLLNPCPGLRKIVPNKVIALGEGLLGWVDFSCGLLTCDWYQDPPVVRFIPLPEPLPGNREKVEASLPFPGAAARSFRDLACIDGVLKFFEMERHMTKETNDPIDKDVLYDSDLITSLKCNGVDEKKPKSRDCWRAVTWSRPVCSNFWRKECTLNGDDILLDKTKHSALLSSANVCGKLTLSDMYFGFPTLSTDDDDILYLMSVVEPGDQGGWMVAVDLGNKTVKATVPCSFKEHDASSQAFRPCTLSLYLNFTPGTEVWACRKMLQERSKGYSWMALCAQLLARSSAIRSCRPLPHVENNPKSKEAQSVLLMAGKNKRARNEPRNIVQNDDVS